LPWRRGRRCDRHLSKVSDDGYLRQQEADDGCQADVDQRLRAHRLLQLFLKLTCVHQAGDTLLSVVADIGYTTFNQLGQGGRDRGSIGLQFGDSGTQVRFSGGWFLQRFRIAISVLSGLHGPNLAAGRRHVLMAVNVNPDTS
jgi:hypothetical protein